MMWWKKHNYTRKARNSNVEGFDSRMEELNKSEYPKVIQEKLQQLFFHLSEQLEALTTRTGCSLEYVWFVRKESPSHALIPSKRRYFS